MRLVRLGQQPSRVAEDIRAALASLGRGNTVIGGVALIGPRPLPTAKPVDAVLLMPRGVIIVLGVDLPDPAMRLEAPLTGQWKADGWPLVGPDHAANPGTTALAQAESLTRELRRKAPESLPIGTIVAVGPFVETVEQSPADLAGTTRVLHPKPTSMLAATISLASAKEPCTVDQARALLSVLAPETTQLATEVLAGEGFASRPPPAEAGPAPMSGTTDRLPAVPAVVRAERPVPAAPVRPQPPKPPAPEPIEVTAPVPKVEIPLAREGKSRTVRWLPMAAIGLLAVLLVAAITVAATSGGPAKSAPSSPAPAVQAVQGLQFVPHATDAGQRCADHAYGDVQASLQRHPCTMMARGSFETTVGSRPVAVSIATIYFGDETAASAFKKTADTPGGGGITDPATETGKWPRSPKFDGAAYVSSLAGTAVRLVLAAWFDGPSSAGDPGLAQAATAALNVQLS
ncbi:MAG TPA: hypothetical protein VJT49_27845 [Amycolatopsis sp.]|uniref:hypothetical protein n=1 Tax=Amycolatopsis sp. TaxID=37632 RepID=UPI002B48D59B|nr:hypothetical protein [Amycolatopsis sp.]HKS48854.1 hypothetical protein [Amycolatopsis sp.]